jgi:MFS family permease
MARSGEADTSGTSDDAARAPATDAATPAEMPADQQGTARDAWAEPAFRRIYIASFLSNSGRWMQQAALGVLAWKLTESSAYLGAIIFAQLGPLAILSLVGGSLADSRDRRKLLLGTQIWQMAWTFLLAAMVIDDTIGEGLLLAIVFVIGLGQGIFAPVFTSVVPTLVQRRNLNAAIALNSAQVNGSRVVGPALGGWLTSQVGFAEVFALNAASYVVVIIALWITPMPSPTSMSRGFVDRIFGGFKMAFRAPQVGRPLLMMTLFSMLCLPFIGQLPAIAELNLGVDPQSGTYGVFYAFFGLGALLGALMVATLLAKVDRPVVARTTLVAFAAALAWLATVRSMGVAYVAIFLVGLFYFVLPTTLNTAWQEHVDDTVRGRVAALWVLSFGGTVPISNIIAGPIVEATSLTAVLLFGAAAAVVLAAAMRLRPGPVVGEELLER